MSTPTPAAFDTAALDWASDADYGVQSDALDGTVTKVEPSTGIITQGARPARQLAAQHRNWLDSEVTGVLAAIIAAFKTDAMVPVYEEYLGDDSFTTPANVGPIAFVEAYGSGGNGNEGGNGANASSQRNTGGGGGGGTLLLQRVVPIAGSTTYDVAIGEPDGAFAFAKGGDTVLSTGATEIVVAPGGQHGAAGFDTGADAAASVRGGSPVVQTNTTTQLVSPSGEGAGGAGTTGLGTALPQGGYASRTGFSGGAPGSKGTDGASNRRGGGPGGGGGAGPGGPGGNGGSGGTGNNAGPGDDGEAGFSAGANTGAGGGGGGGGGYGTSGGGAGLPSLGGSGRLRIIYFVPVYEDP